MEGLLSQLDYFETNITQLSVMGDYAGEVGTGQTPVQGGPMEFLVRGAHELYLDFNNGKLEIRLKMTLENGNDLNGGDSVGPINDILIALVMSMEMELGVVVVTHPNTKY